MGKYRRLLLKISGEALMGDLSFGLSQEQTLIVAKKIRALQKNGFEVAIVVGGGNIFRGIQQGATLGIERTPADQIGMLATLINGTFLKQALSQIECEVKLMSALECPAVAKRYQWDEAMEYLRQGVVLLFVGGTGHPYFTTDTCAALRACEIKADILLKATTRVDGIYDQDPRQEPNATKYATITFQEMLEKRLRILDLSAVTMCMEAKIPIRVFNFSEDFQGVLLEPGIGTLVHN